MTVSIFKHSKSNTISGRVLKYANSLSVYGDSQQHCDHATNYFEKCGIWEGILSVRDNHAWWRKLMWERNNECHRLFLSTRPVCIRLKGKIFVFNRIGLTCVETLRIIPQNETVHARNTFVEKLSDFDKTKPFSFKLSFKNVPIVPSQRRGVLFLNQVVTATEGKYLKYLGQNLPFEVPISHTHETDKDETMAIIWCGPPQMQYQYLLVFTADNGFEEFENIYPPLDLNGQICRFTRIL